MNLINFTKKNSDEKTSCHLAKSFHLYACMLGCLTCHTCVMPGFMCYQKIESVFIIMSREMYVLFEIKVVKNARWFVRGGQVRVSIWMWKSQDMISTERKGTKISRRKQPSHTCLHVWRVILVWCRGNSGDDEAALDPRKFGAMFLLVKKQFSSAHFCCCYPP